MFGIDVTTIAPNRARLMLDLSFPYARRMRASRRGVRYRAV